MGETCVAQHCEIAAEKAERGADCGMCDVRPCTCVRGGNIVTPFGGFDGEREDVRGQTRDAQGDFAGTHQGGVNGALEHWRNPSCSRRTSRREANGESRGSAAGFGKLRRRDGAPEARQIIGRACPGDAPLLRHSVARIAQSQQIYERVRIL